MPGWSPLSRAKARIAQQFSNDAPVETTQQTIGMEAVIEQVASLYSEGRGAHASQNEIQYKKPDDVRLWRPRWRLRWQEDLIFRSYDFAPYHPPRQELGEEWVMKVQ